MKSAPSLSPALKLILEMAPEKPPQLDKDHFDHSDMTYQAIWNFKLNLESRVAQGSFTGKSQELFSETNFKELSLPPQLISGLNTMEVSLPTKIQGDVLSQFSNDKPDSTIIAVSPSGSGKTLTVIMTSLKVVDPTSNSAQVFIICPHSELAACVYKICSHLAQFFSPRVSVKMLESCVDSSEIREHILVGTPDSFLLHWTSLASILSSLRLCAVDEFDAVLYSDLLCQKTGYIMSHSRGGATLLTSTTLHDVSSTFPVCPKILHVKNEAHCLSLIKQYYVHCRSLDEKYTYLTTICNVFKLLKFQIVIFCNSLETVRWLVKRLTGKWGEVTFLSSDLTECQRAFVLDHFYNGDENVLISTDRRASCIRCQGEIGIVNFDLPESLGRGAAVDIYIERILRIPYLRTSGTVVNLVGGTVSFRILSEIKQRCCLNMEDLSCTT